MTLFTFAVIVFVLGLFVGTTFFHMHDASGRTVRPWEGITQTAPITPNTAARHAHLQSIHVIVSCRMVLFNSFLA